uniref:Uncharacterized protein n=1 Tax=Salix viminalis TaxID=40686 RepID=A0A6N2N6M1_SALVM
MQSPVRFSSCRGVSFEIKPHENPFSIPAPSNDEARVSKRNWLPWNLGSSSKVFPSIRRSSSIASSHFCDLDDEDDDQDEISLAVLEEGEVEEREQKLAPFLSATKLEQPSKPARKQESRLSVILLDQGLFTVYKRLFVVCLTLNITGLVLAATGKFPYARNRAALFSIANILALTLCRSEAFLRVVFWIAVKVFGRSWIPLPIKTATTSLLQSLGGIHSSCGISSVAWLISLALLWAFIILTISYDPKTKSYSNELGSRMIKQQEFWFTVAITTLIIIPWITVRRVHVKVYAPSSHASIIKFEGGVKAGILGRISPSPLSEWHAFGIISDGKSEHMMLAVQCDFKSDLRPCQHSLCWFAIPAMSSQRVRTWVAKGIEQNFGKEIHAMMSGHPEDKVIVHDTAVLGRPNVAQMSVDAAKKWEAEVVIVTSNPEGSRDIVNSCKAAGIAAFGPIWDS